MNISMIYYLPGRGGRLNGGLGAHLSEFGTVVGRELSGDFAKLSFAEQVEQVRLDLSGQDYFVVANSFGCYLFLNAVIEMGGYGGKALLLSPMLGDAENPETGMIYCPPRAKRFMDALREGALEFESDVRVLVGSDDWQCNREALGFTMALRGVVVEEIEGEGHRLEPQIVKRRLLSLISSDSCF
jgi:hypothetical protein